MTQLFLLTPGTVHGGVTLTIGEVATHDEVDLIVLTIRAFSPRGVLKVTRIHQTLDVAVVIVMAVARPSRTDLDTIHLAGNEVNNTSNRVSTIGR